jgi:hypothetical protein
LTETTGERGREVMEMKGLDRGDEKIKNPPGDVDPKHPPVIPNLLYPSPVTS